MEEWNNGIMECWRKKMVFSIFQYSIIPIFWLFFSVISVAIIG